MLLCLQTEPVDNKTMDLQLNGCEVELRQGNLTDIARLFRRFECGKCYTIYSPCNLSLLLCCAVCVCLFWFVFLTVGLTHTLSLLFCLYPLKCFCFDKTLTLITTIAIIEFFLSMSG
jgi:hypothetical protein